MVKIINTYLANAFFMVVILVTLLVKSGSSIRNGRSLNSCRILIGTTLCYVLADAFFIVSSLDEKCPIEVFQIAVLVFYIVYVILPFAWYIFLQNYIGATFKGVVRILALIPIVVLLTMVIASFFNGILWSITSDKVYVRGPLFTVYTYLNFFYYIVPIFYAIGIFVRRRKENEPYLLSAIVISLIPLIGAMVNNLVIPIYEVYPFQPFCSMLVALLGFFFLTSKEEDAYQKQQQDALTQALVKAQEAEQKALEASQVKSSFLSSVSHDIRTPMNAIINLTELARKEDDITVVREYLDKMSISSQFLLTLINDILDMSKIESGEISLKKEALTRKDFLNTIETVIVPLLNAKHINYHGELRPGKYIIGVDKMRFNQIFFNLLSNAVKFTPEGGDVWFTVDNLETEDNKLKIMFTVRDNGIGMSEEFQKHLFEPFAREHSELNSKITGTGLGLSIVKNLVEAMHGTITVKSELGKGTEFKVVFYADIISKDEDSDVPKAVIHESKADSEGQANLKGVRILLVEDNEINTYVAITILEKAGCVVSVAENGKEAFEAFSNSEEYSFDAIIMDVRMPVMDGLEATRAIRALDRADAKSVPIIAMTADAFDEERTRTKEAGMDYHLSKPVDAEEIFRTLEDCISVKKHS